MAEYDTGEDQPLIAFLTKIFAQNPERIAEWVDALKDLQEAQQRSIWVAAWGSGVQGIAQVLLERARETSRGGVRFVEALVHQKILPVEEVPLASPVVLDMLWGAFFATGDERHVLRIIESLGLVASPDGSPEFAMGASALWSLKSNAKSHPKVRKVCSELLPQIESDGMRMMLESVVNEDGSARA